MHACMLSTITTTFLSTTYLQTWFLTLYSKSSVPVYGDGNHVDERGCNVAVEKEREDAEKEKRQ